MTEKNYISGFAKERTFDNGGTIISLSLKLEQLQSLPVDKFGNIKIDVCKKREVDQYGNTHYCIENTFIPKSNDNQSKPSDDLPF